MAKEALHQRIDRDGTYYPVQNPVIQDKMAMLRDRTMVLAHLAVDACPEGRELSLALTDLLDNFLPHAIAALARGQEAAIAEAQSRGQM